MTVDGSGLADAFNDFTPLVFKTADFGKTWTRTVEGIDTEAWARVVTPITDLRVHRNDLVAATAGRSFWILDDLSALQQRNETTAASDARLFTPRPAYRTQAFAGFGGTTRGPAAARPTERCSAHEGAGIEILQGTTVVRHFTTKTPAPDAPVTLDAPPTALTVKAGLNRVVEPASRPVRAGPGPLRVRLAPGPPRAAGGLPGAGR